MRHFAPQEAADVTAHALSLLARCTVESERLELELALVANRGIAISQLQGLASQDAVATLQRARELAELLPETAQRALLLSGLGWGFYTRGQYDEARKLAQRVHDRSRKHGDPVLLVGACSLMGVTLSIQGQSHTRGHTPRPAISAHARRSCAASSAHASCAARVRTTSPTWSAHSNGSAKAPTCGCRLARVRC